MTIVRGKPYSFVVTVMQKGSFLPQDLTGYDAASTFSLVDSATTIPIKSGTATMQVTDAVNGKITVLLDANMTKALTYSRGEGVDGYYAKPVYYGILNIKFNDGNSERTAIVPNIRVAPGV